MQNFLHDYLTYADCDEAPSMFHTWAGYVALSASIGRRVWLPRPPSVVYANLFVLFVGDAGCGKSQAMYKVRWVLSAAGQVKMSHSVETPEGILRYLAGEPDKKPDPIISECLEPMVWPDGTMRPTHALLIVANEFVDFIRSNPEAWTGFLNNVYDEDNYTYRTKNQGTDVLPGPYICLIGAIPTDVSKKLQEVDIINTGFARRTIMQYGRRRFEDPKPRPSMTEEQYAARDRCVLRCKAIRKFHGQMIETPEAMEFYDAWYINHSKTLLKRSTPSSQGWLSSKPTQVIKLAMLNSLAARDDLTIQPLDYELGLTFLTEMESNMSMVFGGVGRNELASVSVKILEYMKNLGEPVTKKTLSARFHSSFAAGKGAQELEEILAHLRLIEEIESKDLTITAGPSIWSETLYATPKVMSAWDFSLPNGGVPSLSKLGSPRAAGPSTPLSAAPPSPDSAAQTPPPPSDGTSTSQPHPPA